MRDKKNPNMASRLAGVYFDPLHGKCVRTIEVREGKLQIFGTYGNDEMQPPGSTWTASVHVDEDNSKLLTVSFDKDVSPERRVLNALWCPLVREIHWEDGNVWSKLYSTFDAQGRRGGV